VLSASRQRLDKLEKELAELHEESDGLKARWMAEKEAVQALRTLREQIEQMQMEGQLDELIEPVSVTRMYVDRLELLASAL